MLEQFKEKIVRNFADAKEFKPRGLLIATWDKVGYYDGRYDKVSGIIMVYISTMFFLGHYLLGEFTKRLVYNPKGDKNSNLLNLFAILYFSRS